MEGDDVENFSARLTDVQIHMKLLTERMNGVETKLDGLLSQMRDFGHSIENLDTLGRTRESNMIDTTKDIVETVRSQNRKSIQVQEIAESTRARMDMWEKDHANDASATSRGIDDGVKYTQDGVRATKLQLEALRVQLNEVMKDASVQNIRNIQAEMVSLRQHVNVLRSSKLNVLDMEPKLGSFKDSSGQNKELGAFQQQVNHIRNLKLNEPLRSDTPKPASRDRSPQKRIMQVTMAEGNVGGANQATAMPFASVQRQGQAPERRSHSIEARSKPFSTSMTPVCREFSTPRRAIDSLQARMANQSSVYGAPSGMQTGIVVSLSGSQSIPLDSRLSVPSAAGSINGLLGNSHENAPTRFVQPPFKLHPEVPGATASAKPNIQ